MSATNQLWMGKYEEIIGLIIACCLFAFCAFNVYSFVIKNETEKWVNSIRRYYGTIHFKFNENSIMYKPLFIKIYSVFFLICSIVFLVLVARDIFS